MRQAALLEQPNQAVVLARQFHDAVLVGDGNDLGTQGRTLQVRHQVLVEPTGADHDHVMLIGHAEQLQDPL